MWIIIPNDFCGVEQNQQVALSVMVGYVMFRQKKLSDMAQHSMSSYDLARLHLIAPIGFLENSTLSFSAAAICTTKIGNFRSQPQKQR